MEELYSNSVETVNFNYNGKNGKNFLKKEKHEKHAELFRKDLISAMKMADSENLQPDEYLKISDSWKGEWERGVQVPVNPNAFLPIFSVVKNYQDKENFELFFLPKKLLHSLDQMNDCFKPTIHEPYSLLIQQQNQCAYDLDEMDVAWLELYNESRDLFGEFLLNEEEMERVIEELEIRTHNLLNQKIDDVERLGIEYDESVVCDVCRSPEGEEDNEMVFCDNCDICVHQACYGIQEIPDGSWLCRTCSINIRPTCLLCSQTGGAMKCTRAGDKWAHISCALWIPEVSIGCPEKMEPITDLDLILPSRWTLLCVLCKQESGACIQCSVKSCKVSFHVTCAFRHNLNLTTVIDDETEDVQMKAYCPLHSGVEAKPPISNEAHNSEDVVSRKGKRHKEVFTEQMKQEKLRQIAQNFHQLVCLETVCSGVDLPLDVVAAVFAYWKLKRRGQFNKPLISVGLEEEEEEEEEEDEVENEWQAHMMLKLRMFAQLRRDLERVRNLCCMVNRREKMSRRLQRNKEDIFKSQSLLYSLLSRPEVCKDSHKPKKGSVKFKSRSEGAIINSRLSESDYDNYDDDDDGGGAYKSSFIMKYKRENSDEDDDNDSKHGYDDDKKVVFDSNYDSDTRENGFVKKSTKFRAVKSEQTKESVYKELQWLRGAHKSSGSLYDDPVMVLSCSFQDENHVDCRLNRQLVVPFSLDLHEDEEEDEEAEEEEEEEEEEKEEKEEEVENGVAGGCGGKKKGRKDGEEYLPDSVAEGDEEEEEEEEEEVDEGGFKDTDLKSGKGEGKGREWSRHRKSVKGPRGRPKKKRGRPPKSSVICKDEEEEDEGDKEGDDDDREVVVRENYEDDDSDYYRRLSDEDCHTTKPIEATKKVATSVAAVGGGGGVAGKTKGGRGKKALEVVADDAVKRELAEKKRRGRKRKAERNSGVVNNDDEGKLDVPKKRKYTKRAGRKNNLDKKIKTKKVVKDKQKVIDSDIKPSPSLSPLPTASSSSSSPSLHKVFSETNIDDVITDVKGATKRRKRLVTFDSDDNDVALRDVRNDLSSGADDNDDEGVNGFKQVRPDIKDVLNSTADSKGIDKESNTNVKNITCTNNISNSNNNNISDMLFSSDSEREGDSLVEDLLARHKNKRSSKPSKNKSSTSILLHDLELSDSDDDEVGRRGKNGEIKGAKKNGVVEKEEKVMTNEGVAVVKEEEKKKEEESSRTLIYPPVTKVASLLSNGCLLPEVGKVSSSDEEEEEYDDLYARKSSNSSVERVKSNSKETGVRKQDLLGVKAKHMLLHELPAKEFIVSSHLKSIVRDFFSSFSDSDKSPFRFSFNGFQIPQGKIEC